MLIIREYNILLMINFIAFYFALLSGLSSNPNNLYEILFVRAFKSMFNISEYFIDSSKNIKLLCQDQFL